MANNLCFIHSNDVYTVYGDNSSEYCNLFGHHFYYMQNNIPDKKIRDNCKALLFLHTLPFNYQNFVLSNTKFKTFFNKKNGKGGSESLPYGYLLLLGGLIWRRKYMQSHGDIDPIVYDEGDCHYYKPGKNNTLFCKFFEKTNDYIYYLVQSGQNSNVYNVPYTEFVGTNGNTIIENKLVDYFLTFVKDDFQTIIRYCELSKVNSNENGIKDMIRADIVKLWACLTPHQTDTTDAENINACKAVLSGDSPVTNENNVSLFKVVNFTNDTYAMGFAKNDRLYIFYSESNPIQNIFNNLFFKEVIVTTIPTKTNNKGINKAVLNSYFNGYASLLQEYKQATEIQEKTEEEFAEITDDQRDFKCEIYLTLKNIWDRWLCGYFNANQQDRFTIRNFFANNFIFIDSFYNNIYDTLKLNCERVYNQFANKISNQTHLGVSTVNHLGSVAGDHMCMLFNFPDNVNFAEVDRDGNRIQEDMIQNMRDVFTPIAANKVTSPDYSNKFTVIYTHSANKLDTVDRNKFVHDSFDIWSFDNGTGVAPSVFNTPCGNYDQDDIDKLTNNSRIGYKVPAFGVAYSRQNNSLWKNIQISMDNFTVTEQAVRAEAQIANMGNSEKRNITFYGQDIYSLYQAYSYLVTIEMMGDAQIQPLMYFQLMNVPMFRGTYMIIKVEHSITPGNMKTTFTGMKMSKVQAPYTTSWYTKSNDESYVSVPPEPDMDEAKNGEELEATDGTKIDIQDNKLSKAINNHLGDENKLCDNFVIAVYGDLGVKIKNKLK